MSLNDNRKIFDAYYYAHGCGKLPYERNPAWLESFERIATRIIQDISPHTVLDAGCALGFLVETLRKQGVEGYGVDLSEFAIANVHESIKPYCWQGSITEPFPQKYDLIVGEGVIYADSRVDITDKVIARLKQEYNKNGKK